MKGKIVFLICSLTIIGSSILGVLVYNKNISNAGIDRCTNEVEIHVTSDSVSIQMESQAASVVVDFLKWYKKEYDNIMSLSLLNSSEKYYSVDLSECEAYLNLFKCSGYVSLRYIEEMRSYFETYAEHYKTELQSDGPPEGFDSDIVLLTQEIDESLQAIENIKIVECVLIDSTHQKVVIDITPSILTFSLSYYQATGWLIDNIE